MSPKENDLICTAAPWRPLGKTINVHAQQVTSLHVNKWGLGSQTKRSQEK